MALIECAGCGLPLQESDVHYLPGDGSAVCAQCRSLVEDPRFDAAPTVPAAVPPDPGAPPADAALPILCTGCHSWFDGAIFKGPDNVPVCPTCHPQILRFLSLPKARYATRSDELSERFTSALRAARDSDDDDSGSDYSSD